MSSLLITTKPYGTNGLTITGLALCCFIFCYIGAKFIASQAVIISAKSAITNDIKMLNWEKELSAKDAQAKASQLNQRANIEGFPAERFYFMADKDRNPIAGNLKKWPSKAQPYTGWHLFDATETDIGTGPAYARVFSGSVENQPDYKLLIGRTLADNNSIFWRIFPVMLGIALLALTCGIFISNAYRDKQAD